MVVMGAGSGGNILGKNKWISLASALYWKTTDKYIGFVGISLN